MRTNVKSLSLLAVKRLRSVRVLVFFILFFLVSTNYAFSVNRTLIIFQENGGKLLYLDNLGVPLDVKQTAESFINTIAVTFESVKTSFLANGKYQRVVDLSDANCTREKLLTELIKQRDEGYVVDLLVMGHGSPETLYINNGGTLTGGTNGTLRKLLTDARTRKGNSTYNFSLRLVYMCNCFGSSLNDDWLAIGAKTSVGSRHVNYMPEPMITYFMNAFLNDQVPVSQCVNQSYTGAKDIWSTINGTYFNSQTNDPACANWSNNTTEKNNCISMTRIQESQPVIAGNAKLIFLDEHQFKLNETRTFSISAKNPYNFVSMYVASGETYTFTCSTSDKWYNAKDNLLFEKYCNANGYEKLPTDIPRQGTLYMMVMLGEHFKKYNDVGAYNNTFFKIGTSRTYSPTSNGYINIIANDNLLSYGDNFGSITVTVKRTQ